MIEKPLENLVFRRDNPKNVRCFSYQKKYRVEYRKQTNYIPLKMITFKRTNSNDLDFQHLVIALDKDLAKRNGENNDFFVQYNRIDVLQNVILAYQDDEVIGCGAIKYFDGHTMEIKRMFVREDRRGKGIAGEILQALEKWTKELGYYRCILETGDKMPEAIALYKKSNFRIIPNYGQYVGIASSICFEKLV